MEDLASLALLEINRMSPQILATLPHFSGSIATVQKGLIHLIQQIGSLPHALHQQVAFIEQLKLANEKNVNAALEWKKHANHTERACGTLYAQNVELKVQVRALKQELTLSTAAQMTQQSEIPPENVLLQSQQQAVSHIGLNLSNSLEISIEPEETEEVTQIITITRKSPLMAHHSPKLIDAPQLLTNSIIQGDDGNSIVCFLNENLAHAKPDYSDHSDTDYGTVVLFNEPMYGQHLEDF
uniref:Uncharacterized protein n=1 Tax=Spironucleus salmonicida TaxID=348837 RepID=V6LGJ0_9EUKA|eukprot:EST43647.1 Hypothetical protein SS50377_16690 [Spironucleus salmonicida]